MMGRGVRVTRIRWPEMQGLGDHIQAEIPVNKRVKLVWKESSCFLPAPYEALFVQGFWLPV